MSVYLDIIIMLSIYGISYWLAYHCHSYRIGFRPSDKSISKPLIVPLTVTFRQIIYSSSLGAAFILYLLEEFRPQSIKSGSESIKDRDGWRIVRRHLFGWLMSTLLCVYTKAISGRLRPNFLACNRINLRPESYQDFDLFSDNHPIPKPKTEIEKILEMESRKSFFSGHSCLGTYAATSLILYSQEHFSEFENSGLILPTIQLVIILAGIFPGITQARSHWHHWDDVLAGYFVGTSVAYLNYNFILTS